MDKDTKIKITGELTGLLDDADALYFTDFSGMTVAEVDELRGEFYKSNIKYKVVKNTLAIRALKDSGKYASVSEQLNGFLKGPTSIVFAKDDIVAPAKIIKKFSEKSEKPKLKAAFVDSVVYDSSKLAQLASLPSKKEIIAGILGSLNSPISGIVGSLNAVMRDLASLVEEVAKKKAA